MTGRLQTCAAKAIFYIPVLALGLSMAMPAPVMAIQAQRLAMLRGESTSPVEELATASSEPAESVVDLETFSLRTTTDTEVRRARSILMMGLIVARIDHALAELELDQSEAAYGARLEERRRSRDILSDLERLLAETAISQFKNENVVRPAAVPVPSVDAVTDEALAGFVTDQLNTDRVRASERLEEAKRAVQNAERSLRQAETRHLQSSQALRAERQRFKTFEDRAAEHQRVASEADQWAASLSETVELRSVAGTLRVNSAIEADIDRLIADARLAGLDLGGGGYRNQEQQATLRLANCDQEHEPGNPHATPETSTDESPHHQYVIFEAPASSCSPPTAPPGKSEHEAGLAVDLTDAGQLLTETSPGYRWMIQNGHAYGLANLPGEPWHWSTTGK